ncbi:MAG TPA: hypothetical protein ENN46_04885 [Candidatus Woesearchaeota archaeon]|nr:hypothetical protein [Candidatus Woesearchaeota archaeon]
MKLLFFAGACLAFLFLFNGCSEEGLLENYIIPQEAISVTEFVEMGLPDTEIAVYGFAKDMKETETRISFKLVLGEDELDVLFSKPGWNAEYDIFKEGDLVVVYGQRVGSYIRTHNVWKAFELGKSIDTKVAEVSGRLQNVHFAGSWSVGKYFLFGEKAGELSRLGVGTEVNVVGHIGEKERVSVSVISGGHVFKSKVNRSFIKMVSCEIANLSLKSVSEIDEKDSGRYIKVYGTVSEFGELRCPCFTLSSGGQRALVWYHEAPVLNIENIDNGNEVVVIGKVKIDENGHKDIIALEIAERG